MAAPTPPPPIPLAGLTPPAGPQLQDDSPDQPLHLTAAQLSKIGVSDIQPGDSVLLTARVTIGGTPDAPEATIEALGDVRPDDGSASDLVSLSDDSQPGLGDNGLDINSPDDAVLGSENAAPDEGSKRGTAETANPPGPSPEDKEEKMLGFKRPKGKTTMPSASDVFGND